MNTFDARAVHPVVPLIGRVLLAILFVVSGYGKLTHYAATEGYMAAAGLPLIGVLLPLTILCELGGGLLLMLGLFTRPIAVLLFLFTIPVTLAFHHFWDVPAAQAVMQQTNFLKNLSIMGGLLLLASYGAGAYSVDARRR
ncbi:MAG: DoxX family protein [Burkholderiaceae bacterium]